MDDQPRQFSSPAAPPASPVEDAWISRPEDLLAALDLDPALPALDYERLRAFPLRVPRGFVARMRRGDPDDPLFRQVWPGAREAEEAAGFVHDPVGEWSRRSTGGVIRKYAGRALVVTTGACHVHCRYCFRRHFPYRDAFAARGGWRATIDALATDESLSEVILSGGDPLSLNNTRLAMLIAGLDGIRHLRRLRIHTRSAVVLPERVDDELVGLLRASRLQKVVVLHTNHANEIDGSVAAACERLRNSGALLLNQTVLLAGVNDTAATLARLSERLCEVGVLPYYLHVMDPVQSAAHFAVSENDAAEIMRELAARLPGYLLPKLVRERPGTAYKEWIAW